MKSVPAWKLCVVAGLLALSFTALVWNENRRQPGITWRNFDRTRVGMTLREVEAVIGRECFAFTGGVVPPDLDRAKPGDPKLRAGLWSQDIDIIVYFDGDRAVYKEANPPRPFHDWMLHWFRF